MSNVYQFEYKNMEFSKDGQLDELIALDRYAIPSYDKYRVGDTVLAIVDEDTGSKKVGTIDGVMDDDTFKVKDRFGEIHRVNKELMQKPLETKPHQLWERWSKGAASVEETKELSEYWENEFRWLFDGFRYSLGGRIQLMLGQEYVTGEKANLTAYNCYVIKSPRAKDTAIEQVLEVIEVAEYEGNIMRRGGGVGLNISLINTVKGSGRDSSFFNFILPEDHRDIEELENRIDMGKFDGVTTIDKPSNDKNVLYYRVDDSIEGLFDAMKFMAKTAYNEEIERIEVDFSAIRHRNAIVKGVNGRSSGAVSWMELFVLIGQLIQQDKINNVEFAEIFSQIVHLIIQGGSRRGALMIVCDDANENVQFFITRKTKAGFLTGANISVGISDGFMESIERAKNGSTDKEDIRNQNLWELMMQSAWKSAEPGIIWMERYNKMSNSYYYDGGYIVATNPSSAESL